MKAEDIRQRLGELALDANEYRINAGGAMVLYGLREETHDLDIWCTKKLGDALAQRCEAQTLPDGTRRFVPAPDVEIYENMLPGKTVFLDGIPVAPLEDVLALKRALNREKDQRDIAVLEAALAARRTEVTLSPIVPADIAACTEIYNYYIENTCVTLEEEPVTPEEFAARAARITKDYPYIVAHDGAGRPIGYAYLDVFNSRSAAAPPIFRSMWIAPAAAPAPDRSSIRRSSGLDVNGASKISSPSLRPITNALCASTEKTASQRLV